MIISVIGGILAFVGIIGSIVIFIMTIVKCFKAGDTLWGVLTIFFGLPGLIWLFMNNNTKLGVSWIVAGILTGIGYVMFLVPMMAKAMEEVQKMPPIQQ